LKNYKIAVIEGDGIGREVVPEGVRVLEAVGRRFDLSFLWQRFDWSCERYLKTQRMMPEDGLEQLRPFDAIYLGAVGYPGVPDHVSLWGLLIPIRRGFKQYVNLRPVRLLEGITSPLGGRKAGDIDFVIVRENSEGEYSEVGGRLNRNTEHVTSATKSNGIVFSMPFWDERFAAIVQRYPDVKADQFHIDILSAHFVAHPDWFDVVVGSNLFGDILSDLGAAVAGSMGLAPAANLNPEREYPSLFEPVHGSAPDIAGKGIANPVAQIWTGAMMLRHLGEEKAAQAVERAIFKVLASSTVRTRDIGGKASTREVGETIAAEVSAAAPVSTR
jgi:tartrate dehydrogenase/decarboxylase/D-malate dehydrogenase